MAEITLRDYVKSVDQLIEREKLDEAIAHSRYILETYPKHLDTYRLLGKAYLEAKRYGDSADIFQRVLSAVPDDFVAHIGMAIVREDEGNLDAAIWHMERAFETNPANPAIQQELKRLIGRRDGLEPHKVRLTRGALARMYAHGDLYPQAIAELRSALQEDADRPDLQVLLAEMYWRTDQRAEAAEVCNQVLHKLPYCREANRIVAAILHASGKVDEAAAYHRRLAALDPYAAYVENVTIDPGTVEASSLRMERLEWQAGRPLPAAPAPVSDWASTLGLGADETGAALAESAETPEWLASAAELPSTQEEPPKLPPTAQPVHPFAGSKPPSEEIPDWMSEAGWAPSTGEAREGPVSFSDEELKSLEAGTPAAPSAREAEEAELAPAEIPDWLQAKAPPAEDLLSEAETPEPARYGRPEPPDWMGSLADEARGAVPEPGEGTPSTDRTPTEPEGFGEGEFDLQFGAEQAGQPAAEGGGDEGAPAIPTWLEEVTPGATSTIVTWLGDRAKEGAKPSGGREMPSWMKQASREDFEGRRPEAEPEAQTPEPPSWLEEVEETSEAMFGEEPADKGSQAAPPTPAWLFGVAEAAAQDTSHDLDEVSEFLQEEEPEPPVFEASHEPEEAGRPTAPDWIRAIASSEEEPSQEPAFEEPPVDDASTDWLRGLAGGQPEVPAGPPAPDWLEGLAEGVPPADVQPAGEMDWLRGLGESAREPSASPGVPDWLEGLGAAESARAEEGIEEVPAAEPERPAALPADHIPGWLDEFGTAGEVEAEEVTIGSAGRPGEGAESGGRLDWLEEVRATSADEEVMEAAFPVEAEEAAPGGFPSGQVDDEEVFRWLEDLAAKQGDEEPEPFQATAIGTGGMAASQEPPVRAEVELPEEPGEGLEWLERLAAERGLPEDEIVPEGTELYAEAEEAEQAPEWMLDAGFRVEPEPVEDHLDQTGEDEALGWLEEMAQGEPAEPWAAERTTDELSAPDWLVTMAGEVEETAGAETREAFPAEEEEGLGWLEEMAGEAEGVTELPTADELEWTQFEQPEVPQDGGVSDLMLRELEVGFEAAVPPEPTLPPAPIEEPDEEEVLEWLTRMSAESNQALEEVQAESEEPPEWLLRTTAEEAGPIAPEPAAPPAPPPTAGPPAAPPAPEWLRIPAEEIPAPQPPSQPMEWPRFDTSAAAAAQPSVEVPPAPPAPPQALPVAEVPPTPTVPPPAPTIAGVPPTPPAPPPVPPAAAAPPPAPPTAEVPPVPAAPPPAPPVAVVPPVPTAPPTAPPVAEVPPVHAAPPSAPPIAVVPPVPAAPPTVPPVAVVPPVFAAPPPAPPAAEVPPVPAAPPPAPPAAEIPPVPAAPPPAPPAAEVPPAPPAAPPSKAAGRDPGQMLESARTALAGGEVDQAIKAYSSLIKRRSQLPHIIADLKAAVELDPDAPGLWQALGDAYMKSDQVNDAIEAYRRGMEVA